MGRNGNDFSHVKDSGKVDFECCVAFQKQPKKLVSIRQVMLSLEL